MTEGLTVPPLPPPPDLVYVYISIFFFAAWEQRNQKKYVSVSEPFII